MFPIGRRCARPDSCARRPARRGAQIVLACALGGAPTVGGAQQNLGFETLDERGLPAGWSVAGDESVTEVATDGFPAEGARSLKVTRADAVGFARVMQRVPAAALRPGGDEKRTLRVRLSGLARTESPAGAVSFWLRIDGPRGPLFLDSGGYGREPGSESPVASGESGEAETRWRRYELEVPLPADAEEVAFGVGLRAAGSAWFDALTLRALATESWPAPSPAAARYLDDALALMREHSLKRGEVDWPAVRARAFEHARGATTAAETHLAVRFALRELGDGHSYLQSPAATSALASRAVGNARTGSPPAAPYGLRIGRRIGYVEVPSFAGGTPAQQVEFAETLKSTIEAHDGMGVCGWVVDLRRNSGGNLWPMLAGLGPLLGEGELAASVYPDGRRVPVWHRNGQAGFGEYTQLRVRAPYRRGARAPVAVLLGPRTASSAEVLAVAFRGRPDARSFGAPTRGLSAGNRTFALADGASLVLTVAATSDTEGSVYLGPISPDELTGGRRTEGTSADAALDAGVAWLSSATDCAREVP